MLERSSIEQDQIAVVAVAPKDRPLNGVLLGSAIGAALGFALAAGEEDLVARLVALMGMAEGAGTGALLDAGIPTPEKTRAC